MPKPDPRDMRKELDEGQAERSEDSQQENNQRQPRDPRDPEDRGDVRPDDPEGEAGARGTNVPAWAVSLPPQLRDAFVRGDLQMVPEQYRELVERVRLWLLEQERRESRGR